MILPSLGFGTGAIGGNPEDKHLRELLSHPTARAETLAEFLHVLQGAERDIWIDTALQYGKGNALIATGLALGPQPPDHFTLSIKIGRILVEPTTENPYELGPFAGEGNYNWIYDYSKSGTLRAFDQSFEFLNCGRLSRGWKPLKPEELNLIVYVHDPEFGVHGKNTDNVQRQVRDEAFPTLQELKKDGKLKAIGVGTNEVGAALALVNHPDLDLVMLAGRMTLLANAAPAAPPQIRQETAGVIDLLTEVKKYDKKFVCASPGNSGLAYGGNWYSSMPASKEILQHRNAIRDVCQSYKIPLTAAVMQFPFLAGADAVVSGAASVPQNQESLRDVALPTPPALWGELESKKLINPALGVAKRAASRPTTNQTITPPKCEA